MRTISANIIKAIKKRRNFTRSGTGNTTVRWSGDDCEVRFWGNLIFRYNVRTRDYKTDKCGWDTRTTRSRLQACLMAAK